MTITKEEAVTEAGRCMNCGCYSVNASDLAPVLMALHASIVTNKREFTAEAFFTDKLWSADHLDKCEIVLEITVPEVKGKADYLKFRVRDAIDFAIVSLAYNIDVKEGVIKNADLVFGGVAPIPVRSAETENFLKGKKISEDLIDKAAETAVNETLPMSENNYKIQEMKALIRQALKTLV